MADLLSEPWGECLVPAVVPPPAMAAEVRRAIGAVPGWVPRIAPVPWLVRAFTEFATKPFAYAPARLSDLVALVVSQDNSCRYCYGVQRSLFKIFGYDDDMIARLERDFHLAGLAETERIALDFARKLSRANPRPARRDYEELERAGLARTVIAEVAFGVATGTILNRTATFLALPPEAALESIPKWPLFRLMRPLIAWRMRRAPRSPLPLADADGGFGGRVVAALGDAPGATILRRTIDEALRSEILPRRTKALLFAVVAKVLACDYCERETRTMLRAEGFPGATILRRTIDEALRSEILPRRTKALLFAVVAKVLACDYCERETRTMLRAEGFDDATIDEVLANLGSPRLDEREAMLVPFARETVRYQHADIQRRMREVTVGMRPAEIVELVGVVSLANAVGRLSVLLDVC
ncbi:MAG: hypothetical protein E6J72_16905 [Deltaproteobacteria bacterium]|nr:MAG: hypothetical protein E6J72_16905 [Deltaproteobacteria bacterium]